MLYLLRFLPSCCNDIIKASKEGYSPPWWGRDAACKEGMEAGAETDWSHYMLLLFTISYMYILHTDHSHLSRLPPPLLHTNLSHTFMSIHFGFVAQKD